MIESKGTMAATEVVDRYFAIWNEADPARRRALIEATWSPDASYLDPLYSADGPDGLDALAAGAQAQFPGHRFRLVGALDAHHDRARWGWELAAPDGAPPAVVGVDFAVLAPDGRLRAVTGFFQPPAGPSAHELTTPARGKAGREVEAEGIDVLRVDVRGQIVRAEGHWNAAAFRQALAGS